MGKISPVILDNTDQLSQIVAVFHDITEIKNLAKMRSEFVANVSHELKTPLTSIKGFVETLREGAIEDKKNARRFLDIIQLHAQRLENLVEDILSLSAIESREEKWNFQKTSVVPILETIVGLYKDRFSNRELKLNLDLDPGLPAIYIDQPRIEQAFINLLDNAVKFTPAKGSISIKVYSDNGFVRIDFKDSGIGIEQQHLPRLFERFYRVDKGRSRELGGTGLGLAIVKHIVQSHHGKVLVQSEPQKGSTFSVLLPKSS